MMHGDGNGCRVMERKRKWETTFSKRKKQLGNRNKKINNIINNHANDNINFIKFSLINENANL